MKHILNIFAKTNLAFVTFMEERGELSKNDFKKFSYIKNSYQLANEEGDSVSPLSTRQFGNCSELSGCGFLRLTVTKSSYY